MTMPDSLDQLVGELLEMYEYAERKLISELSRDIREGVDTLAQEIKDYRARYERLTGRTLEETKF